MKKLMILLMILVFMGGKSQSDSISRLKFSGVQVDLHGITNFNGFSLDKQQIMKFVTDDPLLNANINDYSSWTNNNSIEYNGSVGFKLFGTFTKKRKYVIDVFVGMYFGGSNSNSKSYFKQTFDTINTFVGSNGKYLYEVKETDNTYIFSLSSNQVIIPMGLTINTNKQKRFWISSGINIAPGIRTNYVYSSSDFLTTSDYIVSPNSQGSYYTNGPQETSTELLAYNTRRIKQTGFSTYVSIPCNINMRISKKIKFLKHMNASVSVSPGYYLSYDKINKLNHGVAIITNFGLRYNL